MRVNRLLTACAVFFIFSSSHFKPVWHDLLDEHLSQWEMYLSFPHKEGYKGEAPLDKNGQLLQPIGYKKNTNNVFSTVKEHGETVLRISGEIYGCVYTKKEYENYHLTLKVKWGEKKWMPRLHEYKDSGILYHSKGKCGVDYWRSWMLSQEFQIIEKSMGDYWCIANSAIDIKASKNDTTGNFIYNKNGSLQSFGYGTSNGNYCQAAPVQESADGWNTLELITFGDKSVHLLNGKVVMALSNSRYYEGDKAMALTKGKLQLQSEAAEVFFKDIRIKSIKALPDAYAIYFK